MRRRRTSTGASVGILAGSALFIVLALVDMEVRDDDYCQPDFVRAEIAYEVAPGETGTHLRCITVPDYQQLDRDGRIVHP
jgi:hypothetical protein